MAALSLAVSCYCLKTKFTISEKDDSAFCNPSLPVRSYWCITVYWVLAAAEL